MPTLRARALLPTNPGHTEWIGDARVAWSDDGKLTEVEPWSDRSSDVSEQVIDLRPAILTPGFVDSHVHYPQTRIVGAATGPLLTWLATSTFPEEARFKDDDHATSVARTFVTALAAAGTTTSFVYGSVHPHASERLLGELARRGLRALVGPVLMDEGAPSELLLPADQALPALEALADRWHGHDGRLEVAVVPRFALSCSRELMAGAGRLADDRDLWVSTHLAENLDECAEARRRFKAADYLSIYEDAGLLRRKSIYAHCIHLSDDAWTRFADAGAVVAHCPDSNDFLGSGGMPVATVRDRQIPLSVGTDVAAGRSYRVPRILSAAWDNALRQGVRLTPDELLWWGTAGGAAALGMTHVGRLVPGADADLVLHDVPTWVDDKQGALAWLLFHHDSPWPRATWVRGRQVWDRATMRGAYPWDDTP